MEAERWIIGRALHPERWLAHYHVPSMMTEWVRPTLTQTFWSFLHHVAWNVAAAGEHDRFAFVGVVLLGLIQPAVFHHTLGS